MSSQRALHDIAVRIAGDIVMSDTPGEAIRRWRLRFGLSQVELAQRLGATPSVLSDYESGRRKHPGARFIRKFVRVLIEHDLERGGLVIGLLTRQLLGEKVWEAIIDMRDFPRPVTVQEVCKSIDCTFYVEPSPMLSIYGYTVVDSLKLILEVPAHEYLRLYGTTTQRAAIFTNVKYGRSPVIAVKAMMSVTGFRPALIVMHGISKPDLLAIEVAKREHLPLAVTELPLETLVSRLKSYA